jgi:uncharacterized protein YndB with AHSA1/START domain
MPSVTVSRVIAAPRGDVWSTIADVENARRWNTAWSRIEVTSSQRHGVGLTFRAHVDGGDAFDFEVVEWSHGERIAFAPVRADDEHYGVNLECHSFALREVDEGATRVDLTAVASTRGLRGRFVGLLFWPGYQKQGLNEALEMLAAVFEPEAQKETEPAPADG